MKNAKAEVKEEVIDHGLPFKIGDTVKNLYLSDLMEEVDKNLLEREEEILSIEADGDSNFLIKTNFTKSEEERINEENKEKGEEDAKINLGWYIDKYYNKIQVIKKIKAKDLSKIGAVIEDDALVFDHVELPLALFTSLIEFISVVETKEIRDKVDVENEVVLTISGIEFTAAMLKYLLA